MEEMIDMDKKILSIFLILVIVVSITVLFVTFKESTSEEDQQGFSVGEDVTNEDISNEIDDAFLPEDDEVEIGEMIWLLEVSVGVLFLILPFFFTLLIKLYDLRKNNSEWRSNMWIEDIEKIKSWWCKIDDISRRCKTKYTQGGNISGF